MKLKELKEELKSLATQIRQAKAERKSVHYKGKRTYTSEYGPDHMAAYYAAQRLSREYRHMHIAYCLVRGREYDEIESNPKESPNWSLIYKIRDSIEPLVRKECVA